MLSAEWLQKGMQLYEAIYVNFKIKLYYILFTETKMCLEVEKHAQKSHTSTPG